MSPRFIKTTEPIPVPPRGSWRDRYDRGRGIEPPVKVSPGLIAFRGNTTVRKPRCTTTRRSRPAFSLS